MVTQIQAGELYPGTKISNNVWLRAENMSYMVDCLNRSCTVVNPGYKS